jgi:hypothetical protein
MQGLGKRVMAGHHMLFAAFFMQPYRPAGPARPQILNLHLQRRGDAREGIGKRGDQGAIAEVAQGYLGNAVEQLAPLGALEHRRLAGLDG